MLLYLLIASLAGFVITSNAEGKFTEEAIAACFKKDDRNFTTEMDAQEACWKNLGKTTEWKKEFCSARRRGEDGTNPCQEEPFFGHLEVCIDEADYKALMIEFLKEIDETHCKEEASTQPPGSSGER